MQFPESFPGWPGVHSSSLNQVNPWLIAVSGNAFATFMGGDRHVDRQRGAAAHCRKSFPLQPTKPPGFLTSYLVANAVILPASGWFALRFGRKRFLITCIVIFTVSSFVCGAATSLQRHDPDCPGRAGRGRRGTPASVTGDPARELSSRERRGLAMAVFALGVVVVRRCLALRSAAG